MTRLQACTYTCRSARIAERWARPPSPVRAYNEANDKKEFYSEVKKVELC